ncbi:MAG: Sip1-related alpha-galactosidase [Bacilli bacterium]
MSRAFQISRWCSWEQYHKDIDSNLLCEAVDKIHSSGVPIRWVLVDDGFQTPGKAPLEKFFSRSKKFPDGWEPLIKSAILTE